MPLSNYKAVGQGNALGGTSFSAFGEKEGYRYPRNRFIAALTALSSIQWPPSKLKNSTS